MNMQTINILWLSLACLGSYFLGSIPFSVWIGHLFRGKDLREHNVGNPGGMNAVMTFGPAIGILVLFLDFFKGTLTIALIDHLFSIEYFIAENGTNIWYTLAIILGPTFCILGHNYSFWLGFEGGQGVGVFLGVLLYLNPLVFVFHNLFIIGIGLTKKVTVRTGKIIDIFLDTILILLLPLTPPWSLIAVNDFLWENSFIQLKAAVVLLVMALTLLARSLQSVAQNKKTGSWKVGNKGKQQFTK
jgi:acyl-phosphate glycerol 3-phosphate acyltransferase